MDPSTIQLQHRDEAETFSITFDLHCLRDSQCEIFPQTKVIVANRKVNQTATSVNLRALSPSRRIFSVGKNPCRVDLHHRRTSRGSRWISWKSLFAGGKEKFLHLVLQVTPLYGDGAVHIHIAIPLTALSGPAERTTETPRVRQVWQFSNELYEIDEMFGCDGGTLHSDESCAICLAQTRNAVFLPCRHFCCCAPCAKLLAERSRDTQKDLVCPICRQAASHIGVYS
ncbi:hypothetical protein XU18_3629 [Perkinsela sp. CCAP 1560/4]|nr:hypothetical protein XU18_3629 [Perkinsela sp. CCAP 1560/4]|eukprot:KNH05310.1 hypothetical protein XU18_3629 [Perkinsela sp. CCAP 1560/4]